MVHTEGIMKITEPCDRSWDELEDRATTGETGARYCGSCDRNIRNVSTMTRAEADAMVASERSGNSERICVFGMARPDGTLMTADELPGRIAEWLRRRARAAAPMAASLSVLVQPGSCQTEPQELVRAGGVPISNEVREVSVEVNLSSPAPSPAEVDEAVEIDEETYEMLLQIGGYIDIDG